MLLHASAFGQYDLLTRKDGAAAGDKLGWSVSGAGDVNGDGVADYIIGTPYASPSGLSSAGSAFVYSGANGALLFQKNGTVSAEGLGYWVAGAGDVNGDGRGDFIVGSQNLAYVYSGANGSLLYQKAGGGPVAGAKDVNGDGRADFMVSALTQTYIYSGATGALLYQKVGGTAVAGLGDVNGDVRADFLISDQYADPGLTNAGSAYVYSGANGALLYQKNGAASSDLFGSSAAAAGDVNGDGKADFIVGARLADVGGLISSGAAYVYSGATGALLYQKSGAASQQWGQAVGGAGDVDGDGRADFLVSSIWASPGGRTSAGSVYLFSGATGALLNQFDGSVAYENLGYSVSGVGDINGNGRSDFILGGPNASPSGRLYAGSAYVYGSGGGGGPCSPDITAPALACKADKRIGCGQAVVFDAPTATDNCDPSPIVSIVSTTQTAGPGPGETTHTRTWKATDVSGNVSTFCNQDVVYFCDAGTTDKSQIAEASATCATFMGNTSTDLREVCYSVKGNKISRCTPNTFFYYVAVTAPSTSFTVDIAQTRINAGIPYFDVARNGVAVYDNCVAVGSGTVPSPGQARVTFSSATIGKQYVIAIKYSSASLNGTYVGSGSLSILQHYDFAARRNGVEFTRDADGFALVNCGQTKHGSDAAGSPASLQMQSYPNPFNASTQVNFFLPEDGRVRVDIYNVVGQRVRTLVDDFKSAGEHSVVWSGANDAGTVVASGVYFIRISTMDEAVVEKLHLLK
jgi:hypothetical protein